ncbi:MAG: response regulator [Burkholderiales bacterium]
MNFGVRPFFFPTMAAFVDDSADFLANLSLQLKSSLAFRLFDSSAAALLTLRSESALAPGPEQYFSLYQNREEFSVDHHVIDLNLSRIHREIYNEKRFERYSVVVVDYDMPDINGLELCRRIGQSPIRKILLTGKADEKIAVQAFNEGLIDRFFMKHDPEVVLKLQDAIAEMHEAYLTDVEHTMEDALNIGHLHFLRDSFFANFFEQVKREIRTVEHYLVTGPDGILMLDSKGTATLLLVCTEECLREQHDIAYDNAAPADFLEALQRREAVPYFWRGRGHYTEQYADWRAHVYPAIVCNGLQRYYCARVDKPSGFLLSDVLGYQQYLERLDLSGRARFSA